MSLAVIVLAAALAVTPASPAYKRRTGSTTSQTATRSCSATGRRWPVQIELHRRSTSAPRLRTAIVGSDEAAALPSGHARVAPGRACDRPRRRLGRLLRYVVRASDSVNVNLRLVAIGAGAPWFYEGRRGRYAGRLEVLARGARERAACGEPVRTRCTTHTAVSRPADRSTTGLRFFPGARRALVLLEPSEQRPAAPPSFARDRVCGQVDDSLSPTFPLGDALEVYVRREDAERFIEEVRGDEPEPWRAYVSRSVSSRQVA